MMMGGSTFLIGLLPGYATLGVAAPVLFTLLRMMQGLSTGGEYTSSLVFLVERAPPGRRGLTAAFGPFGAILGVLLGSAMGWLFAAVMSPEALADWGWRIPFLLSAVLLVVSIWIRMQLDESPVFAKMKAEGKGSKAPLTDAFGNFALDARNRHRRAVPNYARVVDADVRIGHGQVLNRNGALGVASGEPFGRSAGRAQPQGPGEKAAFAGNGRLKQPFDLGEVGFGNLQTESLGSGSIGTSMLSTPMIFPVEGDAADFGVHPRHRPLFGFYACRRGLDVHGVSHAVYSNPGVLHVEVAGPSPGGGRRLGM